MEFNKYLKEVFKEDEELKYNFEINSIKDNLIKQVFDYRKRENMTQLELANKIGVKQQVISRFEKGNSNVSLEFLSKLTYVIGYLELKREDIDLSLERDDLLSVTSKIISIKNVKRKNKKKKPAVKYGVDFDLWEM